MNGTVRRSAVAFTLGVLIIALGDFAHAESIQFSVPIPGWTDSVIRGKPKHLLHVRVNDVLSSVTYNSRVSNAETGEVYACGSSVPNGTQVQIEFLPEQMAWFATGRVWDSPYAYWNEPMPPAVSCDRPDRWHFNDGTYNGSYFSTEVFLPLYADRPARSVQGASDLGSCRETADGMICTATNEGRSDFTIRYAASTAHQYARLRVTDVEIPDTRWPYRNRCAPFGNLDTINDLEGGATNEPRNTVTLPAQSIACSLTVLAADDENTAPAAPAVSAGGACLAGSAHSISMTATDPGDMIRYLVDWDEDGTADQFVPVSGYVDSGTTQTASRVYAMDGAKAAKVRAQDDAGVSSAWTTVAFDCAESDAATVPLSGEDIPLFGDGVNEGGGAGINDLSLRALPSLVRPGASTNVHWNSQNMTSCTVTGSNGDAWTALRSEVSGQISRAINGTVTYTLSCVGTDGRRYSKSARVNVLPNWTEK